MSNYDYCPGDQIGVVPDRYATFVVKEVYTDVRYYTSKETFTVTKVVPVPVWKRTVVTETTRTLSTVVTHTVFTDFIPVDSEDVRTVTTETVYQDIKSIPKKKTTLTLTKKAETVWAKTKVSTTVREETLTTIPTTVETVVTGVLTMTAVPTEVPTVSEVQTGTKEAIVVERSLVGNTVITTWTTWTGGSAWLPEGTVIKLDGVDDDADLIIIEPGGTSKILHAEGKLASETGKPGYTYGSATYTVTKAGVYRWGIGNPQNTHGYSMSKGTISIDSEPASVAVAGGSYEAQMVTDLYETRAVSTVVDFTKTIWRTVWETTQVSTLVDGEGSTTLTQTDTQITTLTDVETYVDTLIPSGTTEVWTKTVSDWWTVDYIDATLTTLVEFTETYLTLTFVPVPVEVTKTGWTWKETEFTKLKFKYTEVPTIVEVERQRDVVHSEEVEIVSTSASRTLVAPGFKYISFCKCHKCAGGIYYNDEPIESVFYGDEAINKVVHYAKGVKDELGVHDNHVHIL